MTPGPPSHINEKPIGGNTHQPNAVAEVRGSQNRKARNGTCPPAARSARRGSGATVMSRKKLIVGSICCISETYLDLLLARSHVLDITSSELHVSSIGDSCGRQGDLDSPHVLDVTSSELHVSLIGDFCGRQNDFHDFPR